MWAMAALLMLGMAPAVGWTQDAGCAYARIDTFDDEVTVDAASLDPNACAQYGPLWTQNWFNLGGADDDTDWLPHQGMTPTNGTGPSVYLNPFVPAGGNPFDPVGGALIPGDLPPYVAEPGVEEALAPYLPVWPGAGGDFGSPYLYVEATGCCTGMAILESKAFTIEVAGDIQFAFRYHMYGTEIGSLKVQTFTPTDGWVTRWSQVGSAGSDWHQAAIDLTGIVAGVEDARIRMVATTGSGDIGDIAIDDLSLLAGPDPLIIVEDSVLTHQQVLDNCNIHVEFDKPSDIDASCHPSAEATEAELLLNLSLGDNYRYGGTDLGEGVKLKFDLTAVDAAGNKLDACSSDDALLLEIADDRHPEQLYVHDFRGCYADVDQFRIEVLSLDTGGAEYPSFVDDLEFHVSVRVREAVTAHNRQVILAPPGLPGTTLAPVLFAWTSPCDFPQYRFQLLRLHAVGGAACDGGVRAHLDESDWEASALTLEVGRPELALTMMEGSGFYAWRVQPIGDAHPGGEANDLNFGQYTGFTGLSTANPNPQSICPGAAGPGIFWYDDPNDAAVGGKNRTMARAFSRNLGEGEELLVRESISYLTEGGFDQQAQTRLKSQGQTLTQQGLRDFSGRERTEILPLPIPDAEKGDLDYEPGLLQGPSGAYTAADFDDDANHLTPGPMTGPVADYYSDSNPDPGVPNAGGYPFSAVRFTRDGTNRPVATGSVGEVMRLRPDSLGGRTTQVYYSGVGEEELVRIFGHEAPDPSTVEKVITVDPEKVTRVAYVDEAGRTIATCLARNSGMDTTKITSLAPPDPFQNSTSLNATPQGPFRWKVFHEMSFSETTNIELDHAIARPRFQSLCDSYCASCDYRVEFRLIDTEGPTVLLLDSVIVSGEELLSCAPVPPGAWSGSISVDAGSYQFIQTVEANGPINGGTHIDWHRARVRTEVEARFDAKSDPLEVLLEAVADGDEPYLDAFYTLCENTSDAQWVDADGTTWFRFDVGGSCDSLLVPLESCPFDCNPATRDFEAFFNGVVETEFLAYADTATVPTIPTRDDLPTWVLAAGRDIGNGGGFPLSGDHAFFPNWMNAGTPGDIRNVAADSEDLPDGGFNQIIENLIADGQAYPHYEGYDCYNIHYQLEAIGRQYIYTLIDTSVVDRLVRHLGPHFKDTRSLSEDGIAATGLPVDSSVPEADQGWKSHPHKFIGVDAGSPCLTGSAFSITADAVGLSTLDYTLPEERETIENVHLLLHNCLHGPDADDVATGLTSGETELDPVGLTAKGVLEQWREDCLETVVARESVFGRAADGLLATLSGGWTAAEIDHKRSCIVAQLTEHASNLCVLPHSCVETVGAGAIAALEDAKQYRVLDDGSGEFIRYGGAELGPHAASEDLLVEAGRLGTAFESVKVQAEIRDLATELVPEWTADDVDRIAAISYGRVELCSGDCDPDLYELLPLEVAFTDPALTEEALDDILLCEDFESWFPSVGDIIEGFDPCLASFPVDIDFYVLQGWGPMHQGAGPPQLVQEHPNPDCGSDHEVVLTSRTDTTQDAVLGNGLYAYDKLLTFQPGEQYEIELTVRLEQGERMDHLIAAIAPGIWRPQCPDSSSQETFYPPAYTQVIANWTGHAAPLGQTATLKQTFTWTSRASNDPLIASQFLDLQETDPDRGWLHLYPKQYLGSDSLRVSIDDVCIRHKVDQACDSLWVRYTLPTVEPDTTRPETCEQQLALDLLSRIEAQRDRILEHRMDEVEEAYRTACPLDDDLTIAHPLNYYHYTLYYHDAAGRLVRTVPPKGVDADDTHTRASIPNHTYTTEYAHNGLGNLLRKDTPDGGVVTTWYDRLERPRFTQTAQDVLDGQYRYICYDSRSRPIRSGVDILDSDDPLELHVDDPDWPVDDPASDADCAGCTERVFSFYGTPVAPFSDQLHLSDRLSCMANDRGDTIAYRYDSRGNISAIHQHIEGLGSTLLEYEFDAATGVMLETVYNRGHADEFHLRNDYDEDQRIVASYSSRDGRIWHRDATTEYYNHGPAKRREVGHYGVQGLDFTYNLHGAFLALNSAALEATSDPGRDGSTLGEHHWVAPDVFGMNLSRYRGEFGRAGSPFLADNAAHASDQDLLNGVIASVAFQQRIDFGDALNQVGHQYRYDEDGRLRSSTFHSLAGGAWLEDATQHSGTFGYDANGNLTALTRNGASGTGSIDNLTYHHVAGKNQLNHVADASGNVTGLDLAGQAPDNFSYDADGRMTGDMTEGIQAIAWRADGKVEEVTKADTVISFRYNPLGQRIAKVVAPSAGDTITTWYIPDQGGQVMALYRSEGTGGPVLSFNRNAVGTVSRVDSLAPHFGSLLAVTPFHTRHLGDRRIELKDQVGNVRAVVSDLELALDVDGDGLVEASQAQILTAKDYHAYGSLLDGRSYDSIPHRFGFNGMEVDSEIKGEGNSYDFGARHYDPRLGQFLSLDPLGSVYPGVSDYSFAGNDPVNSIDAGGLFRISQDMCTAYPGFCQLLQSAEGWIQNEHVVEVLRDVGDVSVSTVQQSLRSNQGPLVYVEALDDGTYGEQRGDELFINMSLVRAYERSLKSDDVQALAMASTMDRVIIHELVHYLYRGSHQGHSASEEPPYDQSMQHEEGFRAESRIWSDFVRAGDNGEVELDDGFDSNGRAHPALRRTRRDVAQLTLRGEIPTATGWHIRMSERSYTQPVRVLNRETGHDFELRSIDQFWFTGRRDGGLVEIMVRGSGLAPTPGSDRLRNPQAFGRETHRAWVSLEDLGPVNVHRDDHYTNDE